MKKINFLLLFIIVLCSFSVWQFDTDVDLATAWSASGGGAINNGVYMHDSNMATYAYWTGGEWIKAGYYYNNTKPAGATSAKLQLKWKEPAVTENYTYPATCFNAHSTFISYVIYGYNSNDNNWRFMVQCVNATTDIGGASKEPFPVPPAIAWYYKYSNANFYEVDVYWDVPAAVLKITNNTFNMTSEIGGCLTWRRGNESLYCQSTDATPTIKFDTNSASLWSISNKSNMKTYNSSLACSPTGGTTQSCTLPVSQKLKPGTKTLYIAGNATKANSSRALNVNLTVSGIFGGGFGLTSCISAIGLGCGVSIANNCAIINR
jgi:hypothetical protein